MQTQSKVPHVGRNIKTIRFIRGNSQLELASFLGERLKRDFSQQLISDIEAREEIEDDELLSEIAEFLKVTPEALKKIDPDNAIFINGTTFTSSDHSAPIQQPINSTINQTVHPIDQLIAILREEKAELKAEIEKLRKELSKKKK